MRVGESAPGGDVRLLGHARFPRIHLRYSLSLSCSRALSLSLSRSLARSLSRSLSLAVSLALSSLPLSRGTCTHHLGTPCDGASFLAFSNSSAVRTQPRNPRPETCIDSIYIDSVHIDSVYMARGGRLIDSTYMAPGRDMYGTQARRVRHGHDISSNIKLKCFFYKVECVRRCFGRRFDLYDGVLDAVPWGVLETPCLVFDTPG